MRYPLIAFMLVLLPFQAFAGEERNCSIGLSSGQIAIDPERFHISSAEARIMQDPRLITSRTVEGKTSAQQISLGCMLTEHWGADLLVARGIKFSINNTIAPAGLAEFEVAHGIPINVVSATVTRTVEADTTVGVIVSYTLPITSSIKLRFGGGAYHIALSETSQIAVGDSSGQKVVVPGPSEKKSGYVPVLTAEAEIKVFRDVSLFGQLYVPGKGVHATFVGVRVAF